MSDVYVKLTEVGKAAVGDSIFDVLCDKAYKVQFRSGENWIVIINEKGMKQWLMRQDCEVVAE